MDTSTMLAPEKIKKVQQIVGILLYYARAVDPTLLVALSSIGSQQEKAIENTWKKLTHVLDYCVTHPNAIFRYTNQIWYSKFTAMHHTYRNQWHTEELEGIFTLGITHQCQQFITGPF